jgi:hypothetical protein
MIPHQFRQRHAYIGNAANNKSKWQENLARPVKKFTLLAGSKFFISERLCDRANHSNRRSKPEGYAVWEIHPVMALHVVQ